MLISFSALDIAHSAVAEHVRPGDVCIDATAGRGRDTVFLCGLVGQAGRVTAFDIQPSAVESTREAIEQDGYGEIGRVFLDSHEHMDAYEQPETVACVMFNLGWLPGGDHNVFTAAPSSIAAIEKAMALLKPGGIISICIYYGRETGYEERDAVLAYLETLDHHRYSALVSRFVNRPNCPPIVAFILKDR